MSSGDTSRPILVAIGGTLVLGAGKLVVALITGSQAVFASAADSIADAGVSGINFYMARHAEEPPDAGHPFGHGKAEALASLIQGAVLCTTVGLVVVRALQTLLAGAAHTPEVGPALVGMGLSMVGSLLISTGLMAAAKRTGSLVLRTDAVHYRMDLYTGAAVVAGLVGVWAFGRPETDPIASLLVAAMMARDVYGLLRDAVGELMDQPLPPEELVRVEGILAGTPHVRGWHDLRTRKAGARRFVQVHVVLPATLTFPEAHRATDNLERAVQQEFPGCDVLIHADVEGEDEAPPPR